MRYLTRTQGERCMADIKLRDGSVAQCQRYRAIGLLCKQHAKLMEPAPGGLFERARAADAAFVGGKGQSIRFEVSGRPHGGERRRAAVAAPLDRRVRPGAGAGGIEDGKQRRSMVR